MATSGHTLHFSLQEVAHSPHLFLFTPSLPLHPTSSSSHIPPSLQGSVWINNSSRIIKSDYTTSNGIIHHIDSLLTPYRLQDQPNIRPNEVQRV